jgi:tetratricopeptide (TPR) repeat protein
MRRFMAAASLGAFLSLMAIGAPAARAGTGRIDRLNHDLARWFADHPAVLAGPAPALPPETAVAAQANWAEEALAQVTPQLAEALKAFDRDELERMRSLLAPLCTASNPYLSHLAQYYDARAAVAQGMLEEAEELLIKRFSDAAATARFTARAPHARLLLAHCQAANLRYAEALATLEDLPRSFPDAPESVLVAARQLALEVERRERGTLGEVATIMDYTGHRLAAADATSRVQKRQDEIIELLDKLIEDAQKNEKQQGQGGGGGSQSRGRMPQQSPSNPLDESRVARGAGQIGDLHTAPQANPGEAWGKLPPAEREKILERLREKYPSRYRQLVEQYYRTLAGDER